MFYVFFTQYKNTIQMKMLMHRINMDNIMINVVCSIEFSFKAERALTKNANTLIVINVLL